MPTLARASPERELQRLIRLYLKAETDIINEIGRLRSRGLVDYHAVAAAGTGAGDSPKAGNG